MLASLHIENIAVIKSLDIDFAQGFSAFTGETGAGKSIIMNSLDLLCGEKLRRDMIRTGEDNALVSALFTDIDERIEAVLSENGIPCQDGEIFVSRYGTIDGKTTTKVNGRTVPAYVLRSIMQMLLAIHGQHSSQALLDPDNYIGYLDAFSESDEELHRYRCLYDEFKKERSSLRALMNASKDKSERMELLRARIKEIDRVNPKPNEEQSLLEQRLRIKERERISKQIKLINKALYKSSSALCAADLIDKAFEALNELYDILGDEKCAENAKRLADFKYEIEDIALSTKQLLPDDDQDDKEMIDRIETRLDDISSLKKKFGADIEEIAAIRRSAVEELERLDTSEILIKETKEKLLKISDECRKNASRLTEKRRRGAIALQRLICNELSELDMKKIRFRIDVSERDEYDESGANSVSFLISANEGEDERPVDRIASGGELSRIMLAMQTVFRRKNNIPTVIYDEIDTGISGGTCEKIGKKLQCTAEGCQVFAITHSAQIASTADNHYLIYKEVSSGRTETKIKLLSNDERIKELSRIIGGVTITESVESASREMIENGKRK